MKQKLIVSLVASAVSAMASHALAQTAGQCSIIGNAASANGATPVTTGPLNPVDGFPEWLVDSNGVKVQRCLDPNVCFADPLVPTDPFSLQIGSGGESFYWSADAIVSNAAGNRVLSLGMAAEAAFLTLDAAGAPVNGSQFPFLRIRFVMGVPVDGIYTVKHPYGTDTFTVTGATGARDVFSTVDRGFAPNSTVQGSVGPFLRWDPTKLDAGVTIPAGYLGVNPVNAALAPAPQPVMGSPCGGADPWNYVEISGVDNFGNPVDFGIQEYVLRTDLFNVQGRLYDGATQTPLNATRQTYSRTATGAAQIDSFALSTRTATVTVTDGPTIPTGSARIGAPQTLDHTELSPTEALNSLSVIVAADNAATLPPVVQVTATDANAASPTDPTTLNLSLVDFVDILQADFDPVANNLIVSATSSDDRLRPTLTLRDFGTFVTGVPTKQIATAAPPAFVTVDSAAGGSATAQVRVITAGPSLAPTDLAIVSKTATTVTLRWSDNSTNELGFKIYSVTLDGTGNITARTEVGTVAPNTNHAVITGLTPGQAYNLQVDAFNGTGAQSSGLVQVTTLALPAAPTGVLTGLGSNRAINIAWTDNSTDETGFVIYRSTTVGGTYTQVATAPAGATSAVDLSGLNATTYFYKVAAVRDTDSNLSVASAALTTDSAPSASGTPTLTALSATSVRVNWTDRSINERAYQVYRRTGAAGTFAPVSGLLAPNTVTFTDTTALPATQYFYRVDTSNWTGAVASAVSAGLTTPNVVLAAPGSLTASSADLPVLNWVDTNSFETGYRVLSRPITFTNTGVATTNAAQTTLTTTPLAANSTTFTETRALTGQLIQYQVLALNGATAGTAATAYAVPGGMTVPQNLTFTRPTGGNATNRSTVTFNWTALLTAPAVGGYALQRCNVTATQDCLGATGWVAATTTPAALTGRNRATATSVLPSNTVGLSYRFRLVSTTGTVVTGITSSPSNVVTVTR